MSTARGRVFNKLTREAVEIALEGFALPLLPERDWDWLASAVRRALTINVRDRLDAPDRPSNAEIRRDLERLAALAESTWYELFECDEATDHRLWTFAWRRWDGEGGSVSEPLEYRRFKATVAELEWLASFMRGAARSTTSQRGPWRQSEEKRLRVLRGQYLAPIYEAAFGEPVSANNFPTDARIRAQTPYMDFYGRMVTLAFGARETANLTEVVKAACQLHRQDPVEFAEGIIPGL